MDIEFISLFKLGVGPVLVRFDDIITMELTPLNYTRIEFGYGEHLIVEQTPHEILQIIRDAKLLNEQISQKEEQNSVDRINKSV
jgi:hypothetical protein